jgi:type IV pilus assembly protein PilC
MLFSPRISTTQLVRLCRRLATSLEAGLDLRGVWAREAKHATRPATRSRFRTVSESVNQGESLYEALSQTDDYFPPLFRELAHVGEQTGHLPEAFRELADHYEFQIKLTRTFLLAITWPLVELGVAILAIGVLIYALGAIGQSRGMTFDVLGLGLGANMSLLVYIALVVTAGFVVAGTIYAIHRGLVWTNPVQRALLRVPVLGKALESLALARLAWSLHLTLMSGMDIRRAVRLSVRSARNARYTAGLQSIDARITAGDSLFEAFVETYAYPDTFLDVLRVGEEAGKLDESMARLARQYREEAESAMKALGVFGFFVVFGLIALMIIVVIFRLVTLMYLGPMYDALEMI